ncbi:UvrABC system subunit C [Clostridium acetobutylicum]|nr:UvrABC system subunit C [Clostridium acetobutylicum]
MEIKEKIRKLPYASGVYLMKDSLNTIIYVGKSKNLRSRVQSYFVNSKSHSSKVLKLVKNLKDFDYIVTDTEFEALLLECKLIKRIKPIYNRQMKNPKGYCYIKVNLDEKYPSVEIKSNAERVGESLYFGPYTSKSTVEKALYGIKEHMKILCTNSSKKASGCLKYSTGLCLGMCTANPSLEYYSRLIEKIIELLSGKDITIVGEMEKKMNIASSNFDFEDAAKYRDYIKSINHLTRTAKIINFIEENKNIVLVESLNNEEIKCFLLRYNKVLFCEKYKLSDFSVKEMERKIMLHLCGDLNNIVNVGKDEIDEVHIIYNYLKSKESTCRYIDIKEQWVNDSDSLRISGAVDEVIRSITNNEDNFNFKRDL